MGYGGPHAGYLAVARRPRAAACPAASSACRVDADGRPALPPGPADPRAAHPPREGDQQHLHRAGAARRDRRRCTPSTTAATGCAAIAARVHGWPRRGRAGCCGRRARRPRTTRFFDTVTVRVPGHADDVVDRGPRPRACNLRRVDADTVGVVLRRGRRARRPDRRLASWLRPPARPTSRGLDAGIARSARRRCATSTSRTSPTRSSTGTAARPQMLRYLRRLAGRATTRSTAA